jgi:hypothetical protein
MNENIDNNDEKKSNSKIVILLIVLMIVLSLCTFGLGYLLGSGNKTSNSDDTVTDNKQDNPNVIDEDRLTKLVIAGIKTRNVGSLGESNSFLKGYSKSLTVYDKIKIVLTQTITVDKNYKKVDDIPSNMKSEFDSGNYEYYEMKIDDFKNTYKYLFGEELNVDISEIHNKSYISSQTCPYVVSTDSGNNIIYLHNIKSQCDNLDKVDLKITSKNINISSDDNYYYVDQDVETFYPGTEQELERNITTNYKVKWKFDKNYNFISTEVEKLSS